MINDYQLLTFRRAALIIGVLFAMSSIQAQDRAEIEDEIKLLQKYAVADNVCYSHFVDEGLKAYRDAERFGPEDYSKRISSFENAAIQFRAARVCLENHRTQALLAARFLEMLLKLEYETRMAALENEISDPASEEIDIRLITAELPDEPGKRVIYDISRKTLLDLLNQNKRPQTQDTPGDTPAYDPQTTKTLINFYQTILADLADPETDGIEWESKTEPLKGLEPTLTASTLGPLEIARSLQFFKDHQAAVISLDFSPDGQWLLSRARDSTVTIRSMANPKTQVIELRHNGFVHDATWTRDSRHVITACSDSTAIRWNIAGGVDMVFRDPQGAILAVQTDPQGQLLTASRTGLVRLYNSDNQLVDSVDHGRPAYQVEFSPDGKGFLSQSPQGVKVWSMEGESLWQQSHREKLLYAAHFDGNIDRVITSSTEHILETWDLSHEPREESGEVLWRSDAPIPIFRSVGNGLLLATNEKDSIAVWPSGSTGRQLLWNTAVSGGISASALRRLPDNSLLMITADDQQQLHFWRDNTPLETLEIRINVGSIRSLAISPNGHLFAMGLTDGQMIIGEIP